MNSETSNSFLLVSLTGTGMYLQVGDRKRSIELAFGFHKTLLGSNLTITIHYVSYSKSNTNVLTVRILEFPSYPFIYQHEVN